MLHSRKATFVCKDPSPRPPHVAIFFGHKEAGRGADVRDNNGLGDLRILERGTLITNAVQTRH